METTEKSTGPDDPKGQVDGLLTAGDKTYLKQLEMRLISFGFSWQHEDYLELIKVVPKINKMINAD